MSSSAAGGVPHVAHAKAKEAWARTKDPQIVSTLMPRTVDIEYRILKYMASEIRTGRGHDWEGLCERAVLKTVPWKRRLLFIYAYFRSLVLHYLGLGSRVWG